ncbi:agrin-like [Mya arenaria]|uniref:agrin-like n=1 Tax=Mya arenaria TaxID=6604 RepID=UPI0022DF0260|nr:agrin-like [Mya arenaria]
MILLLCFLGYITAAQAAHAPDCNHDPMGCIELAITTVDLVLCEAVKHLHCDNLHGHVAVPHEVVCGTDGVTYDNHCTFAHARCKVLMDHHNQQHGQPIVQLNIANNGPCTAQAGHTIDCKNQQLLCIETVIMTVDVALCHDMLHIHCDNLHGHIAVPQEFVCGTNGFTYDNHCLFAQDRCKLMTDHNNQHKGQPIFTLDVATDGTCTGTPSPIDGTGCHHQDCIDPALSSTDAKICLEINNIHCKHHAYEPICASDGVTYSDHCTFAKKRCTRDGASLTIQFMGECHGTVNIQTTVAMTGGSSTASPAVMTTAGSTASPAVITTAANSGGTGGVSVASTTASPIVSGAGSTAAPAVTSTTMPPTTTTNSVTMTSATMPAATTPSVSDLLVGVFCKNINSINCSQGFDIVCGSDGKFYPNPCELSKASCSDSTLSVMPDLTTCSV